MAQQFECTVYQINNGVLSQPEARAFSAGTVKISPCNFTVNGVAMNAVISQNSGLNVSPNLYFTDSSVSDLVTAANEGGFLPSDLSDLWGWWSSDAGVVLSGSDVVSWTDQSENGIVLTVTPSLQSATFQSNVLNGFGVLKSKTGLPTNYQTSVNFPNCASTGLTVFIIGSQTALNDTFGGFIGNSSTGTGDTPFIFRNNAAAQIKGQYINDAGGATVAATNGTFYSIRFTDNLTVNSISLNNGTPATNARGSADPYTGVPLEVFWYGGSGVNNKQIAEIFIYTRPLTAGEITQVENYLNDKYNLY